MIIIAIMGHIMKGLQKQELTTQKGQNQLFRLIKTQMKLLRNFLQYRRLKDKSETVTSICVAEANEILPVVSNGDIKMGRN